MAAAGPGPGLRTAHAINERERTSDVLTEENSNVDFASMFLSEPVTAGLRRVGFEKPSPIQLKAIPLGRCGLDLIVQAKSGTGKTCVFSVIALESIDLTSPSTQVLVLAPTREIAVQIQDTIRAIGCEMEGLRCHVFIGGTLFGPDRQKLKKCHIAVGTPGRIKQLIEYEVLKTGTIRLFVLDEADKLLDDTFQEQVNWVYNHLSDNKQMLALSATYPEYLAKHLIKYMREPMFVRLNPKDLALRGIKQLYVELDGHSLPNKAFEIKVEKLLKILTQVSFNQCLIFSNLQTRAQNLCDILCDYGWPSECISGAKEQSQRLSAMAKLKKFQCRILISTDLTARGIDAENVNLIINLDIPTDSKTYLHRIGRAGRFGTHGAAISLASKGREMELLQNIQHQCRVIMTELPDPAPSDLLKQDLNPASLQQASTSSESHLTTHKMKPSRNTTTDDEHDSDTPDALDNASQTSSIVNQKESKPKTIIPNGTENNIISLVSYEQISSQVSINGSKGKLEHSTDSLVAKTTTVVVESTNEKCCKLETKVEKVDVCVQTMTEDGVFPNSMASQITGVDGSRGPNDRSTLPIGFEEVPEVRKLRLPQWVKVKGADATRRAFTWYEGRQSFEKFMRERTVEEGTNKCEDGKVKEEADVITQTSQEHEELSIDTSRYDGKADDGDPNFSLGIAPKKNPRIDCGSQSIRKEEVQSSRKNTPADIGHFPKKTCGPTPILEIERYRALLYNVYMGNHTGTGDTPTDFKILNNEQIVTVVTTHEAKAVESPTVADNHEVCQNQVTREYGDGQDSMQSLGSSGASSKELHGTLEISVNQSPTDQSKTHETKDIDETVRVPHVDDRLRHQVSTDSLDIPSGNELKTETKSKSRNTAGGRKKVRQQRMKQHVFQMSTLGALMSPKQLDLALVSNPNISSCDGDLDSNDTDKEKLERFPLSNKVNQTHPVHHSKDLSKSGQGDTKHSMNPVLGSDEIQILDSHGNETLTNEKVKPSSQRDISQENDASISSLDDPVWAIFKNFKPAALPLGVDIKPSSGKGTSSEESSSSLCESDTSSCSASSSEDGNSETGEEQEESLEELQRKERSLNGHKKDQIKQKDEIRFKKSAKSNGSLTKENCNYQGYDKDGEYLIDSNWRVEQPYEWDGLGYDQSHAYYATAPHANPAYSGWLYPGHSFSAQFYPHDYTSYWGNHYHRHVQPPHSYPYFSSYWPYT